MRTQEKFYDLPTGEPPPFNRRVYAAAKLPFKYLWEFLVFLTTPWLQALPLALIASFIVNAFVHSNTLFDGAELGKLASDTVEVGLVWAFYLGFLIACLHIFHALFK